MKITLKKILTIALAMAIIGITGASAIDFVGGTPVDPGLQGGTNLVGSIQAFVVYLTNFLYIVAVIIAIWAGFQILTAAGDEEKVKKGKTTIIHALVGLIVIFLASSIIKFVLDLLQTGV